MLNTGKTMRKKHLHDHKVDMGSQMHIGDPKNSTTSGPNYQSNPMERERHIWDLKGEIENRYALTLRST